MLLFLHFLRLKPSALNKTKYSKKQASWVQWSKSNPHVAHWAKPAALMVQDQHFCQKGHFIKLQYMMLHSHCHITIANDLCPYSWYYSDGSYLKVQRPASNEEISGYRTIEETSKWPRINSLYLLFNKKKKCSHCSITNSADKIACGIYSVPPL